MYSQPLADAIAEAERLVTEAPFIESEADLLEGLQYLAGCIAACTHVAFDYDREHPFLHSGTGPFTKMGLDNPDTMYFGTRVQPGHEYVVTGRRGTTTDVSFQLIGGEYTDEVVPDSETAFDDRKLDIAADGAGSHWTGDQIHWDCFDAAFANGRLAHDPNANTPDANTPAAAQPSLN